MAGRFEWRGNCATEGHKHEVAVQSKVELAGKEEERAPEDKRTRVLQIHILGGLGENKETNKLGISGSLERWPLPIRTLPRYLLPVPT